MTALVLSHADRITVLGNGYIDDAAVRKSLGYESDAELGQVADLLEDCSADEVRLFFAALRTAHNKFDDWGEDLADRRDYRIGLLLAHAVSVCCAFLDEDDRASQSLSDKMMLLILSTHRSNEGVLGDFKPEAVRGAVVERIVTGGNDVDGTTHDHLRWLSENYRAISPYSSLLRDRMTIDRRFIDVLLAGSYPAALESGVL